MYRGRDWITRTGECASVRGVNERIPAGYVERRTQVGDVAINYVRGGEGPTLLLLHGYPQTWYMWRKLLPELARHFTVVAADLRGAGGSDAPECGYDKKTLAADMHGLLTSLGLAGEVTVVGHDIGTMVAFAYAAAYRDEVSKLVLTEAPIPDESLYRAPALTAKGPAFWNFGFLNLGHGDRTTWRPRLGYPQPAVQPGRPDGCGDGHRRRPGPAVGSSRRVGLGIPEK